MNVVQKTNNEVASLNHAVIIRRGRNTFANITKDYPEKIQNAMNEFKNKMPQSLESRCACLGMKIAMNGAG